MRGFRHVQHDLDKTPPSSLCLKKNLTTHISPHLQSGRVNLIKLIEVTIDN